MRCLLLLACLLVTASPALAQHDLGELTQKMLARAHRPEPYRHG